MHGCEAGLELRCCDPSILFPAPGVSRLPPLLLLAATAMSHHNPPQGRFGQQAAEFPARCLQGPWHSCAQQAPEKMCLGLAQCWGALYPHYHGGIEQAGEQRSLLACGEGSVVQGNLLIRESSEKVLGFPREQDLTALLLPRLRASTKGVFVAKAHQIIKQQGVNKSAAFSVVCGLMLFIRYLENWDRNISKSPCFTGLNLKIGTQNMWFAVLKKKNKPSASWRSAAAPGELRGQRCCTPAIPQAWSY